MGRARPAVLFATGLVAGVAGTLLLLPRGGANVELATTIQDGPGTSLPAPVATPPPAAPSRATTPTGVGPAPLREDARPLAARPEHLGILSGSVRGDREKAIPDAEVSICFARRSFGASGEVTSEFREADAVTARTDAEGKFEATFERGGVVQVRASAPGYKANTETRVLPPPPYHESLSIRLGLEESELVCIRGRVVDLEGKPHTPDDLHFLFPLVDDDPESLEPFQSVSWIHAFPDAERSTPERAPSAAIHGERGTFEIRVRRGWRGTVALLFRDRVLQRKTWSDGDPEIEFRIDIGSLRSGFGVLEVRVLDGETRAPVPGAKVQIVREGYFRTRDIQRVFRQPSGESVRVADLPPGLLTLWVSAGNYAMATARAEIVAGATTRLEVPLRNPATLRVRLVPLEGWLPEADADEVESYDPEGIEIDLSSSVSEEGTGRWVRLDGLSPEAQYLVLSDNVLRVRLSPGPNPDLEFPIRRHRNLNVRYRLGTAPPEGEAGPIGRGYRVLHDGRVPIRDWTTETHVDSGGWSGWGDALPPGRYTLELGRERGGTVREDFEVGLGEETTVVVDR